MNGRMIEFSREGCQVQVFDIHYGHKLTGAGKGPELAQAYLKGLEGTGERRAWSEGQRTKVLG